MTTDYNFIDMEKYIDEVIKNFICEYLIPILDIVVSEEQNNLELIIEYYNKICNYYITYISSFLEFIYTNHYCKYSYIIHNINCLNYIVDCSLTLNYESLNTYSIEQQLNFNIREIEKICRSMLKKRNIKFIKSSYSESLIDFVHDKLKNVIIYNKIKYNSLRYTGNEHEKIKSSIKNNYNSTYSF